MSRPPECAATFFKTWRSILLGHLGLQSVTYRVETPCSISGQQIELIHAVFNSEYHEYARTLLFSFLFTQITAETSNFVYFQSEFCWLKKYQTILKLISF
jgi:hypothetical protein